MMYYNSQMVNISRMDCSTEVLTPEMKRAIEDYWKKHADCDHAGGKGVGMIGGGILGGLILGPLGLLGGALLGAAAGTPGYCKAGSNKDDTSPVGAIIEGGSTKGGQS